MAPTPPLIIQGYGDGGFRVGGQRHEGSLLLTAEAALPWSVAALDDLDLAAFDPLFRLGTNFEILLLGCGRQMAFLDPALRQAIRDRGLAVEVMDSGAACRTFNLLVAEGRTVAAALIAVE